MINLIFVTLTLVEFGRKPCPQYCIENTYIIMKSLYRLAARASSRYLTIWRCHQHDKTSLKDFHNALKLSKGMDYVKHKRNKFK